MGGIVAKQKFVTEDGRPRNFYRLQGEQSWLCGGLFPAFSSIFDHLKEENVGLIVTLTLDSIKNGRNINHLPFEHENTEWVDGDQDLEEKLKQFQVQHLPLTDGGFPTPEQTSTLLEVVRRYHQQYPNKSVYVHCWLGRGRTTVILTYLLMQIYGMNFEQAFVMVRKVNPQATLLPHQRSFLKGELLSEQVLEEFAPVLKTPPEHRCYQYK